MKKRNEKRFLAWLTAIAFLFGTLYQPQMTVLAANDGQQITEESLTSETEPETEIVEEAEKKVEEETESEAKEGVKEEEETAPEAEIEVEKEAELEAEMKIDAVGSTAVSQEIQLEELEKQIKALGDGNEEQKEALKVEMQEIATSMDTYSSDSMISNEYLEIAVASDGKFTIGTVEGNPNYTTDNNQTLLFGHPSPWSSETMINIDGDTYWFEAESINIDYPNKIATAYMSITEYNVIVTQVLSFIENTSTGRHDNVKISYSVLNGSDTTHNIGIRIMMDTMLADNDHAPFKISGYGNVTECKNLTGDAITQTYQVYDDLDAPTTMATGVLWLNNDRHPDKVMYTNWGDVNGSSWNYFREDGSYLGDSAVAIYFNPISVSAGTGTSVNTYYGTGIGLATGTETDITIENKIEGTDFALYVTDSKTGEPIVGAKVELDGIGTVTTDEKGAALFENVAENQDHENVTYRVTHEGFQPKSGEVKIVRGNCASVLMKGNNDTQPMLLSAQMTSTNSEYNNIDLLRNNAYFNSNEEGVEPDKNNSDSITITVTSDTDGCVYQLISDNSVVAESENGIFTLNVLKNNGAGKTYTIGRICEISAGKKVYVQAVSDTGETSQKSLLGIKVSAPASFATNLTTDVSFMTELDIGDLGDAAEICRILFGTDELKLSEGKKLPLKVSIDEDGKVRVAYNLYSKDWETTEENYAKLVANRVSAAQAFGGSASSYGMGNLKVDFNVAGYGEGYCSDGAITVNLGVYATLSGSAEYTHTFFVGWVPLYIKVGATGELNAELGATVVNNGKLGLKITTGKFEPSFSLYAEAGAGVSGVLSAGVQGKGTLNYQHDFTEDYDNVSLTASASIEVKAFLYSNSLNIAKKTWTLYDSNNRSSSYAAQNTSLDMYEVDEFEMISRTYQGLDGNTVAREVVEDGVYIDAKPVLVTAGDNCYRFWIGDDESRTSVNRTALMYSIYDKEDESWGEAVILDNDNTGDFAFNIAVSGSDIYVVCQEMCKSYSDEEAQRLIDDSEQGLATMAGDSIISMLRVSGNTVTDFGIVSEGTEIDANSMGAMAPRITINGSEATLIWTSNSANDVLGADKSSNNYIWYTSTTISESAESLTLKTPQYVKVGTTPVTSMDVGVLNGNVNIAYVVDVDQNLITLSDRELYLASGLDGSVSKIKITQETSNVTADENPVFAKINGVENLVWYEGGNYCYTATTVENAKQVFANDNTPVSTNNGFAVLEGANATAIAWYAASSNLEEDSFYYSLYAVKNIDGTWGKAYEVGQMSAIDSPMLSSLSGYVDADNMCHASYAVVKYDEDSFELENSSLNILIEEDRTEVALNALDYDYNSAYTGNTFDVTASLKNTGTKEITNLVLKVADTEFEKDLSTEPLMPGEERNIVFSVTLSEINSDCDDYNVCVYAVDVKDGSVKAISVGDFTISVNYTDVSVTQADRTIVGNAEYYSFIIENKSNIKAENVNFKVLLDVNDNGTVVLDESIGTLEAGKSTTIMCRTDLLSDSTVAYGRLITSTEEIITTNNEELICSNVQIPDTINTSILTVETNNVEAGTVTVPEGFSEGTKGTYTKTCETNEVVTVNAVPAGDEWAFTGWKVNGNGTVSEKYSATTTFYMGDGEATLTATFATKAVMTGITLQETYALSYGAAYVFTPNLVPANTSDYIVWSTSDENVVTVDEDGYIKAVGTGTAIIKATSSGNAEVYDECTVTVSEVKIEKLRVVYPNIEIAGIGEKENLRVLKTPVNATEAIKYSSDHPEIVSVDDNGMITTVSAGTAVITAKSASGDAAATTTVKVTVPLMGIYFRNSVLNMEKGQQQTVAYVENPVNTTDEYSAEDITWSASVNDVVTVTPSADRRSAVIKAIGVGTAVVTVRIGDEYTASFTVYSVQLIEGVTLNNDNLTMYRGEISYLDYSITPNNADGEVSWSSSNTDVATVSSGGCVKAIGIGTTTITITSDTGYKDTCQVTVRLNEVNVTSVSQLESAHSYSSNTDKTWKYTVNNAVKLMVTFDSKTKVESSYDYISIYDKNNTLVGRYTGVELASKTITIPGDTVKINLKSDGGINYYGFKVTSVAAIYDISSTQVTVSDTTYNGKAQTPSVTVMNNGVALVKDTDYSLSYKDNMNAGKATVTVTGKGNYIGTITKQFTISKMDVAKLQISIPKSCVYTGKAIKPSIVVNNGSIKLTEGKDYTIEYKNNKNIGTAKVTIGGKGNYTGTSTKTFKIVKKTAKITASNITKTVGAASFNLKAKVNSKATLYYSSNNKKVAKVNSKGKVTLVKNAVGTAKITIKSKATKTYNSAVKVITIKVIPKSVSGVKVSGQKKAIKLSWKKNSAVTGYQIQYSTNKKFTKAKTVSVKKASTTSKKISKLNAKKTYYVRMRTYKKVSGKTYYSNWTTIKTVKTK